MATVEIEITVSGTFFAPGADVVIDAYCHRIQDDLAAEAERNIHLLQNQDYKNPSGFYERHITNRDMGDRHLIHDSNVVYGGWLEGISERNFPMTRFPGYATFRRTTQTIEDRAVRIAEPHVKELCRVMNK